MAGYWPIKTPNKEQGQAIPTEQARSKKDLLYMAKNITPKKFAFSGTKRAIPSGQDRPISPARVANQNTGFASTLPLLEPAI